MTWWRVCRKRLGAKIAKSSERTATGLHLPLDHHLLDLGNRLRRIEVLRAGIGAVQDGVAAIEPERVLEIVEPLAGRLVAAVDDPAPRLQKRGRAEEAIRVPPVA